MTLEKIKALPCSTKDELLYKLMQLVEHSKYDEEEAHYVADQALLDYINHNEITRMFHKIDKWYA